jgi:hypothetical protein
MIMKKFKVAKKGKRLMEKIKLRKEIYQKLNMDNINN